VPNLTGTSTTASAGFLWIQPQNTGFDISGITKLVNQGLAKPDCEKFASTILNRLSGGKGGSLVDVFNAFLNPKKPHVLFMRTPPPTSRGKATTIGSLKKGTAQLFLQTANNQTQSDADGVIAELFHLAGDSYSEKQLADEYKIPGSGLRFAILHAVRH
jgi:hypothetical protein